MSATDLRRRSWLMANNAINLINSLNEVIFEESANKPPKIENRPEDATNVSLQYIQDGIDLYNTYKDDISKKTAYLQSLIDKNQECMTALTQLVG